MRENDCLSVLVSTICHVDFELTSQVILLHYQQGDLWQLLNVTGLSFSSSLASTNSTTGKRIYSEDCIVEGKFCAHFKSSC